MVDKLHVKLTNPAQFLACCGLLELAALYDPHSTGRFANGEFVLDSVVGLRTILNGLLTATIPIPDANQHDLTDDIPVTFYMNGSAILLDWWNQDSAQTTKLKCWSKGSPSNKCSSYYLLAYDPPVREKPIDGDKPGVLIASQRLLTGDYDPSKIFDLRVVAKRLDIDPRTSWKVDNIGYSQNDAKDCVKIETYAVTEMLAVIGLQRLRLRYTEYFEYHVWTIPLCVQTIAAANYCDQKCRRFRFYRESRGKNNSRFDFAEEQF